MAIADGVDGGGGGGGGGSRGSFLLSLIKSSSPSLSSSDDSGGSHPEEIHQFGICSVVKLLLCLNNQIGALHVCKALSDFLTNLFGLV